jgi:hypothetical protein
MRVRRCCAECAPIVFGSREDPLRIESSRELLAARPDAWRFLAEPHHLPDWWPGVSGVVPDRRGLAAGARWQVVRSSEPTLLRKPRTEDTLLVRRAEEPAHFAFHLVGDRLDVDVTLEAIATDRTRATIGVEGAWLLGQRRTLARRAARRLYDLCQTAASL